MAAVIELDSARSPLDYALRYAARGWAVLPLLPGKKAPHGRLVPNGHNDATTDPATIRTWFASEPTANVGIQCSGSGIVAIDIDPRNGGLDTLEALELEHGEIPSDVLQLTPNGGQHRILAASSRAPMPGKLGPGIDVKWDGYIVAEPSVLAENGRGWSWEASSDPMHGAAPPPMPEWIRSARPPERVPDAATLIPPEQVADVRSALAVLDADDREAWVAVGMALHATGAGAQAYGLWTEWSQQSDKYNAADQTRVWRSFKARGLEGLSLPYVFKAAQSAGWVNPRAKVQRGAQDPIAAVRGALPLEYADDLSDDVLAIPQLVEDSLTAGGLSVVYGESNSGKTYLVIDMACAVARGTHWLGKRTVQGAVLYVAGEGAASVRMRLLAYRRHHQVAGLPVAIVPVSVNLLDPAGDTDRVIEAARTAQARLGQPIALIVIDTLARAMGGGNENASEDMGAVVTHADRIRTETGAHLIFIHHSGKDATKGARGSSVLRAAVDTEIEVTADSIARTHTATFTKQRDLATRGDALVARFLALDFGLDQWGKAQKVCVVEPVDPATIPRIELLTGHQKSFLAVARHGERYDVVRTAFYRVLGDIAQDAKQKAFIRTAKWARETGRILVDNEILLRVDDTQADQEPGHDSRT